MRNPSYRANEARKRGIHPGFEIQDRRRQKSKTWVSVAPQIFFKKFGSKFSKFTTLETYGTFKLIQSSVSKPDIS